MKVNIYRLEGNNTGVLKKTNDTIIIEKNRWLQKNKHDEGLISYPMFFTQPKAFANKNVYYLNLFGNPEYRGIHISLSFCENQKFRLMQRIHWIQKEENLRYIVNILFLLYGVTMTLLNYLKK